MPFKARELRVVALQCSARSTIYKLLTLLERNVKRLRVCFQSNCVTYARFQCKVSSHTVAVT